MCEFCGGHSGECRYSDDDMLLYAYMQVTDDYMALVSANEVSLFDDLLKAAHDKDANLILDEDTCENIPYKIIYGAIMVKESFGAEKAEESLNQNLGHAYLNVDDFDGKSLVMSTFDDFMISKELSSSELYLPFVALARTNVELHDSDISYTFFPYFGGTVWESMVNKPFVIACRETLEVEGLTKENWKDHVSWDDVERFYEVADKYTGGDIDDEFDEE